MGLVRLTRPTWAAAARRAALRRARISDLFNLLKKIKFQLFQFLPPPLSLLTFSQQRLLLCQIPSCRWPNSDCDRGVSTAGTRQGFPPAPTIDPPTLHSAAGSTTLPVGKPARTAAINHSCGHCAKRSRAPASWLSTNVSTPPPDSCQKLPKKQCGVPVSVSPWHPQRSWRQHRFHTQRNRS